MALDDLLTANDRPGEYPPSWYAATARLLPPFPSLAGDVEADVCVVGGGYTGLSAALHLAEAGLSVVLVEAQRVGWGASGRNGGQVGSGQRRDQDWLEAAFGRARAHALWDMAEEAKALVRGLVDRHGIACDLRDGILHAAHRARSSPPTTPRPGNLPATTATTPSSRSTAPASRRCSTAPATTAAPSTGAAPISIRSTTRSGSPGRPRRRGCASSSGAGSRRSKPGRARRPAPARAASGRASSFSPATATSGGSCRRWRRG